LFGVELTSMKELFTALDRNRDGNVSAKELSETLTRLGVVTNEKDCQEFIAFIDVDQSGSVNVHELELVVKHEKLLSSNKARSVHRPMQK
jgi:Ca2+-binding EF-hand superfamily protein